MIRGINYLNTSDSLRIEYHSELFIDYNFGTAMLVFKLNGLFEAFVVYQFVI